MSNQNGTRPPGTKLFVPGYMPDDMQSEYDMQQDQFAGSPFGRAQRRRIPYAGMRRPGTMLGDRPGRTDCFVPGYLSDETQHRLDDEALGIAPLVIAGAMKVPSLFNPKATRGNAVERFNISQQGGTPRGSKTGGMVNAKIIIDQVYNHMKGDDPSWVKEWNQIYSIAIPDLRAYMQLKMGPLPPTKPGPGQPISILPPAPVGTQPYLPVPYVPPQPTTGPIPVDYTDASTFVPGTDQPAPSAPRPSPVAGLMDMLQTPSGMAMSAVALYLLFGGGKKGRR